MTEYYVQAIKALAALAQDRKALDARVDNGPFDTGSRVARNSEIFNGYFADLTLQNKRPDLQKEFDIVTNYLRKNTLKKTPESHNDFNHYVEEYKRKHETWESKITGIIEGYEKENSKAHKHLEKGRRVTFNGADVRIEKNDSSAKSYQMKYTGSTSINDVNNIIIAAIEQLTGQRNEYPDPDDELIAEVTIGSIKNSWPFLTNSSLAHYSAYSKNILIEYLKSQLYRVAESVRCYTNMSKPVEKQSTQEEINHATAKEKKTPVRYCALTKQSNTTTEIEQEEHALNNNPQSDKLDNTTPPAPSKKIKTDKITNFKKTGDINITLKIAYQYPILVISDNKERHDRPHIIVSKLVISLTLKENRQFDFALEDERCTPPLTSTLNMLEGLPLHGGVGIDSSEPTVMNTEN